MCNYNEASGYNECDDTLYDMVDHKYRIYAYDSLTVYQYGDDGESSTFELHSDDVDFNLPSQTQLREACSSSCSVEIKGTGCAENGYDDQCNPTFNYDDLVSNDYVSFYTLARVSVVLLPLHYILINTCS